MTRTKTDLENRLEKMMESYHSEQLLVAEHVRNIVDQLDEDEDPIECAIATASCIIEECEALISFLQPKGQPS